MNNSIHVNYDGFPPRNVWENVSFGIVFGIGISADFELLLVGQKLARVGGLLRHADEYVKEVGLVGRDEMSEEWSVALIATEG
jgi:hypothetical protein